MIHSSEPYSEPFNERPLHPSGRDRPFVQPITGSHVLNSGSPPDETAREYQYAADLTNAVSDAANLNASDFGSMYAAAQQMGMGPAKAPALESVLTNSLAGSSMYSSLAGPLRDDAVILPSDSFPSDRVTSVSAGSPQHPIWASGDSTGAKRIPGQPRHSQWPAGRPLSVVHINAALLSAGIENWIVSLAKYSDPERLHFRRCLVLNNWVDPNQMRRTSMPITVGGDQWTVKSAISDADVVIVSDSGRQSVELAQWIVEAQQEHGRPAINLFVLHGDGHYTANRASAFLNVADRFVAISEHVRRQMSPLPTTVIRNGVDPQRLIQTRERNEFRASHGFTPRDFVVGFVGRFSVEKNPLAMIEAVAAMPPHCKALLVGFGSMREQVVEHAIRLLPSRFTLIDGSGLENLGDHYHAMDALSMPSKMEGYGLVGMEAMMCGVPVIAAPCGLGADLLQDGVNGLVVPSDAGAIARAIGRLASDRRFARSIAKAGEKTAKRYGYAASMAGQYESLISDLWQHKQAPELVAV